MPERVRAAELLTEFQLGERPWDGEARCQTLPTSAYWKAYAANDQAFVRLVEELDWSRVMLQALHRHVALAHPDPERVCGECLREALLMLGGPGWPGWRAEPDAPRERPDLAQRIAHWTEREAREGWRPRMDRPAPLDLPAPETRVTPPRHRREWPGRAVQTLTELRTGAHVIPPGTRLEVVGKRLRLRVLTRPCSCCQVRLQLRVRPAHVELLPLPHEVSDPAFREV